MKEERERAERRLVLQESAEAAAAVQEHFNQSLLLAEQKVYSIVVFRVVLVLTVETAILMHLHVLVVILPRLLVDDEPG